LIRTGFLSWGNLPEEPVTEENYTVGAFTSYEERAQFILRAGREPGEIEAHVRGDGLEEAEAIVHIHP